MTPRETDRRSVVGKLAFFGAIALTSFVLLLTALVSWTAELVGSLPSAALLLGILFGLLAVVAYFMAVRDALAQLREEADLVLEVMRDVQRVYRWVNNLIRRLFG